MDKKNHSNQCPLSAGINRREFLKDVGKGAVVAAATPTLLSMTGCELGELETVNLSKPSSPPAGVAPVSVVRKDSIQEAVSRAIELAGGLSEIKPGDTVVLKPNIVGVGFGVRPYTHPMVIQAVIREIKELTATENIVVAEGSYEGPGSKGTVENATQTGILDVVEAEGVRFIPWNDETVTEFVEVISDDIQHVGYNIEIPKMLVDGTFDHFINLPIIKNHTWMNAGFTCSLKNFVGTMRLSNRNGYPLMSRHDWIDLARGVAELNLSIPVTTMNILDGLEPVLKNGPMYPIGMVSADANLIVASKDRVAADTMALAVMRYYAAQNRRLDETYQNMSVWEQPQISRALELNLGRTEENISPVSEDVDEMDDILSYWC